jgi:hypothetical protein
MPATQAPTKPRTAFLSQEAIDATAKDTAADERYVQVSKQDEKKLYRYRIMGPGITGYLAWLDEGGRAVPIRWRELPDELPANLRVNEKTGKVEPPKRFISALVWDYKREMLAIMELTQKSVIKAILDIMADEDNGDPQQYDIKIKREGTGLQTKYTVTAGQLKPTPEEAIAAMEDEDFFCNLENVFDGLDPFDPDAESEEDDEEEDEEEDDEEE